MRVTYRVGKDHESVVAFTPNETASALRRLAKRIERQEIVFVDFKFGSQEIESEYWNGMPNSTTQRPTQVQQTEQSGEHWWRTVCKPSFHHTHNISALNFTSKKNMLKVVLGFESLSSIFCTNAAGPKAAPWSVPPLRFSIFAFKLTFDSCFAQKRCIIDDWITRLILLSSNSFLDVFWL